MMFYKNKCTGCQTCKEKCPNSLEKCTLCGECTLYCPNGAREICGKQYTADEVLDEVVKDRIFYDSSDGGVTFSGGECMLQLDFLLELLKACKENGIHTAVDTAGHVPFEYFEKIFPYTDMFLYDVKCVDGEKHKKYTGVDNGTILENLSRLLSLGKAVWVRIPIIPGVNDTKEEMLSVKKFLNAYGHPQKVELLPYHAMGEHKYAALGKEAKPFLAPDEESMARLKENFS